MRRAFALLFVFAVVLSTMSVLGTQSSCANVPNNTCSGERVNVLLDLDSGSDPRRDDCTRCMQRQECCDRLGACGDDETCVANFKAMQRCELERGATADKECRRLLADDKSLALYTCVRKPCGVSCGIPSCDLDQAVTLFGTAECDSCITGACCTEINACYTNRQCKLFLECITDHCPKSLGPSLDAFGKLDAGAIDALTTSICSGQNIAVDTGACLARCFSEYVLPADGGNDPDDRAAGCLALNVYACGAKSGCGPRCLGVGAAVGPYAEDDAGN